MVVLGFSGMMTAGGADAAEARGLPALVLSSTAVVPGETVAITGSSWPPHRLLQAQVCGGGLLAVSSDCDITHAVGFGPADNGVVATSLIVTVPPVPCPCVVLVTQLQPNAVERLPITIAGAPSAPLPAPPPPIHQDVTISDVHVVDQSSWTSWFGAAASRELVLTVHNGGATPVRPLLLARWEQGGSSVVITSPRAAMLRGGGTTQIDAPFALSTFAHGQFPVMGSVTGSAFDVRFASATSTTPWGLYGLAVVLAVCALLALAVLLGDRRQNDVRPGPLEGPDVGNEATAQLSQIGAGR